MNLAFKMDLGNKRPKASEGAQPRMLAGRQSQRSWEGKGLTSGARGNGASYFILSFNPLSSEMKNFGPLYIHSHPLLFSYLGLGWQSGVRGLSLKASTQGLKTSSHSIPALMESNHFLTCHRKGCPPVTEPEVLGRLELVW